jgi:hypothetical protein
MTAQRGCQRVCIGDVSADRLHPGSSSNLLGIARDRGDFMPARAQFREDLRSDISACTNQRNFHFGSSRIEHIRVSVGKNHKLYRGLKDLETPNRAARRLACASFAFG